MLHHTIQGRVQKPLRPRSRRNPFSSSRVMEEITDMINKLYGKNSESSRQQKDNSQSEGTPFDVHGAGDLDTDSIFEQTTPCGRHVMPVTVDRLHDQDPELKKAMEYFMSIQSSCIEQEIKYVVDLRRIRQPESEIREWHRNGIINWLIDAQSKLELNDFTLFLAINIFDRCLGKWFVCQKNIYLVGITCLWIAHKYEEISNPWGDQYVDVLDSIYNTKDIVKMEAKILDLIDYELTVPTSYAFLMRLFKVIGMAHGHQGSRLKRTAQFLISLSLMDASMMRYRPSIIAAAAVCLAVEVHDVEVPWDDTMEFYSGGWSISDIRRCKKKLTALWVNRNDPDSAKQQHKAFAEKFKLLTW